MSGDAQVRALAASAGLAVFATVSASEAAPTASLIPVDAPALGTAVTADGPAPAVVSPTTSTAPGPGSSVAGASAVTVPDRRSRYDDGAHAGARGRSRGLSHRTKVMGGSLAIVALVGGGALYGAYVTIPRASITLTQTAHPLPPETLDLRIVPDQPTDISTGVIHGQWLPVPVTVQGTVTATGSGEPLTERARGTVTFTNHSVNPIPIRDQTVVQTPDGVRFLTQGGIVVPQSGSMDVEVWAEQTGGGGNVDAGTITIMSGQAQGHPQQRHGDQQGGDERWQVRAPDADPGVRLHVRRAGVDGQPGWSKPSRPRRSSHRACRPAGSCMPPPCAPAR